MITKRCGICNRDYSTYPFDEKNRKFCSHKCYWQARRNNPKYGGFWKGKKRDKKVIRKLRAGLRRMIKKSGNPRLGLRKRPIEETKKLKALWASQRRAIKLGNGGSHTLEEWETLKAQYNWKCPRCKKAEPKIKLTVDHIIPVTKGGSNNIENIQPLCQPCNSSKQTKIIKYE